MTRPCVETTMKPHTQMTRPRAQTTKPHTDDHEAPPSDNDEAPHEYNHKAKTVRPHSPCTVTTWLYMQTSRETKQTFLYLHHSIIVYSIF